MSSDSPVIRQVCLISKGGMVTASRACKAGTEGGIGIMAERQTIEANATDTLVLGGITYNSGNVRGSGNEVTITGPHRWLSTITLTMTASVPTTVMVGVSISGNEALLQSTTIQAPNTDGTGYIGALTATHFISPESANDVGTVSWTVRNIDDGSVTIVRGGVSLQKFSHR